MAEPVAAARHVATLMPATGLFPEYVRYCVAATDAPPLYYLGAALALASRAILATLKEAGQVRERQEGAWYRWA
jgi:hypothetical protein